MVKLKADNGKPRGCLAALLILAIIIIISVIGIWRWSITTSGGEVLLQVLKGNKGLEDLTTDLAMTNVMRKNGVPEEEYRELETRLGDIKPAVNAMDEGEKGIFAAKINDAAGDGHLSEGEIDDIVSYKAKFDD